MSACCVCTRCSRVGCSSRNALAHACALNARRRLTVDALAEAFRDAASDRDRQYLPKLEDLRRMIRGYEAGEHVPRGRNRMLYCAVFDIADAELFSARGTDVAAGDPVDDEIEALELARRASASDVGAETIRRLEAAVDDLAVAYPRTPPAELVERVRRHLAYVSGHLDARKTLGEHQRLLVIGGWLSLLAATCHVDLHQRGAATARLRTAASLAEETGQAEIAAWCLETEAWQALTDGDYRHAVTLSRGAQAIGPVGGSAYIQASAQEGRAWARLGAEAETHRQLDRVAELTRNMPGPERPEHHYRYDPAKADAYTATTLAWLGDPAAEPYAPAGADPPAGARGWQCPCPAGGVRTAGSFARARRRRSARTRPRTRRSRPSQVACSCRRTTGVPSR